MFYIAYVLSINDASCFIEIIALTDFYRVSKICFVFHYCYIYSPTCQTVVSNPFLWYSGPDPVVLEEEPEEATGELQCVIEWRANNVI